MTDSNALYLFSNLPAGDYFAQIPQVNFGGSGVLFGATSSTGQTPDSNAVADDNHDHGAPQPSQGVVSTLITLATGTEATGENPSNDALTPDDNSNLTVDFGYYKLAAIGDFVWLDTNRNGQQDMTEPGLDGLTVKLLDATGTTVLATTTTGGTSPLAYLESESSCFAASTS